MATIESLCVGLPVIAFDVLGNNAIITDNYNGFLIDYGNVELLLYKTNLLINNTEMYNAFSNNARNSVCNIYTLQNMIQGHENLLKKLIYEH